MTIPEAEWPATGVRDRFYAVGPAIAFLLDRFRPGWKEELEGNDGQVLDELLGAALEGRGERGEGGGDCRMEATEVAAIEAAAVRDAGAVVPARGERRRGRRRRGRPPERPRPAVTKSRPARGSPRSSRG